MIGELVWAALWRAQVAHLVVIVLGTLAGGLAQILRATILLPFLLVGGGNRDVDLAASLRPLASPGCWVMLAPCVLADREWMAIPAAQADGGSGMPDDSAFAITARHAWFAGWLGWFVAWLFRRERRRLRQATDGPGADPSEPERPAGPT